MDYRTRQVIQGRKLLWLDAESTIRWKTFAVKQVGVLGFQVLKPCHVLFVTLAEIDCGKTLTVA